VIYGGDSGNRIFVLYWRCPLIIVSVIRGSTVLRKTYLALVINVGTPRTCQHGRNTETRHYIVPKHSLGVVQEFYSVANFVCGMM
jgi:hypothetical protein